MKNTVRILALAMAVLMLLASVACGKTEKSETKTAEPQKKVITATAAEIEAKIRATIGEDKYIPTSPIDAETLPYAFDLDMTKITDIVAYESNITAVYLDTVVIMKVADDYVDTAVAALNARFANFMSYIRLYSFGAEKVKNARLYVYDNYIAFVLTVPEYDGEDAEGESAFILDSYAKLDAAMAEIFGVVPENKLVMPEASDNESGNQGGLGALGGLLG